MQTESFDIPGPVLITPRRFGDARGYFSETWHAARLTEAGIDTAFVQDNESLSVPTGTLRGLHFQSPPHAQAKLVRVAQGVIFDVAVDIRRDSPTYGQWCGAELSAQNGAQLFIPAGFLHGFVTRTPDTLVIYKCSDYYAPECDGAVRFDDPDLAIDWGIAPDMAVLSDKDAGAQPFAGFRSPFSYAEGS